MIINRVKLFDSLRISLGGKLSTAQVKSINNILDEGSRLLPNVQALAYLLATAFHETGHTMLPVEEYGKGKGFDYGKFLDMGTGPGKRVPYKGINQLFYGRGYIQITWLTNYRNLGRILGKDLVNNPELALDPTIAIDIAIQGMLRGYFTGRRIKDFFPNAKGINDPLNARRMINGMDCAQRIAGYYKIFLIALTS